MWTRGSSFPRFPLITLLNLVGALHTQGAGPGSKGVTELSGSIPWKRRKQLFKRTPTFIRLHGKWIMLWGTMNIMFHGQMWNRLYAGMLATWIGSLHLCEPLLGIMDSANEGLRPSLQLYVLKLYCSCNAQQFSIFFMTRGSRSPSENDLILGTLTEHKWAFFYRLQRKESKVQTF